MHNAPIIATMLSCVIINFNGKKMLTDCLKSVSGLEAVQKEIIVIDNASSDGSAEYVKKHWPHVQVVANQENTGYAGAADQAVSVARGEYILILNPDILFEADYAKTLLKQLEADPKIGAIIGKLRKYDFEKGKPTTLIDSAGLLMYRNRRCVDRGQGEQDLGQFDEAEEVFGVTGACPLYRRAALEEAKISGEYFDRDFFMYKEDVDISWRLRLLGWKCFYEPKAMAYHGRGTGVLSRSSSFEVAKNRGALSRFQKYHSYRNERLMRVKNELSSLVARDFFPIVSKEVLMTGWMTLREPYLWKAFGEFLMKLPRALKKRLEIMRRRKASAKQMGRWFV